jgi:hypothetical protein
MKKLLCVNLGLGLWLMISPLVLELVTTRAFQFGWEDFLLGFGIASCSLCRLLSGRGTDAWDIAIMSLGLTTLLNPVVFDYLNVRVVAWNNLIVGSMVLILALRADWKTSESRKNVKINRDQAAWHS